MKDLIEALNIFLKYRDDRLPSHCEHDTLWVACDPADVSATRTNRSLREAVVRYTGMTVRELRKWLKENESTQDRV